MCCVVCISNRYKLKTDKMDRNETPSESPPAYTAIAPPATWYPDQPPPYSISEHQHLHSSITPEFMLSTGHSSAAFPFDTVYLITRPLPRQPNQQHQQQQVVYCIHNGYTNYTKLHRELKKETLYFCAYFSRIFKIFSDTLSINWHYSDHW